MLSWTSGTVLNFSCVNSQQHCVVVLTSFFRQQRDSITLHCYWAFLIGNDIKYLTLYIRILKNEGYHEAIKSTNTVNATSTTQVYTNKRLINTSAKTLIKRASSVLIILTKRHARDQSWDTFNYSYTLMANYQC